MIWPVMAGVGPAVSERIVLFRHGPVTFGASVIGTAVSVCIGVSRTGKLRNGEYGQGSLGQIGIGLFRLGNVWHGLAVEARQS